MEKEKNLNIQKLRAFLIFLVIIIHSIYESKTKTENYILIFLRQICNITVPTFFFISGYYFNKKKISNKEYITKKVKRLFIPLIIWNIIYFIINKKNLSSFFTFQSSSHLYFIVVLIQLILLTPLIHNLINKKWIYIFTPLYLIIYRVLLLKFNYCITLHEFWVFGWIIYYQFGINYQNNKAKYNRKNIIWFVISFVIELMYQLYIYNKTGFANALSQMNIVNMIVSINFIKCIFPLFKVQKKTKDTIINRIGDSSFGIYFMHMIVLRFIKVLLQKILNDVLINVMLSSLLTVTFCYIIIRICNKLLPKKINNLLGF